MRKRVEEGRYVLVCSIYEKILPMRSSSTTLKVSMVLQSEYCG